MAEEEEVASSPHAVIFEVTVEVEPEEPVAVRYNFLKGERVESHEEEAAPKKGSKKEAPSESAWETTIENRRIFRKRHEIEVDEALVEAMDAQPIVSFFLSTKTDDYACTMHCDLSAFFANETTVVAFRDSRGGDDSAAAPKGLRDARVTVTALSPFFSDALVQRHNPLKITIGKVKSLPGARTDSEPLQKYVQDPHSLHGEHCRHVFCAVRPPLAALASKYAGTSLARWSASDARLPTKSSATFNHTVVYLTGRLHRDDLEELLATKPVTVEVHDRDLVTDDDQIMPEVNLEAWNRLARGEVSFQAAQDAIEHATTRGKKRLVAKTDNDKSNEPLPKDNESLFEKPALADVDALFTRALVASWARAGDEHSYGHAEARVEQLLEASSVVARAFKKKPVIEASPPEEETDEAKEEQKELFAPCIKLKAFVSARKRRAVPKGGTDDWRLNEAQRLAMQPGAYADAATTLTVTVSLAHLPRPTEKGIFFDGGFFQETWGPQPFKLAGGRHEKKTVAFSSLAGLSAPFCRAFLFFPCGDVEKLRGLTAAIDAVNAKAIKTGSLKSYQLTPEEVRRAEKADLDVICGFSIIDANSRIVVVEGLAATVEAILEKSGRRLGENDEKTRTLADSRCRFTSRLYTCFSTDLKKIKLRSPLFKVATRPDIYDRAKVDDLCFQAVDRLMNALRARTLRDFAVHDSGGFPEAAMIQKLESQFGEPVSVTDVDGSLEKKRSNAIQVSSLQEDEKNTEPETVLEPKSAIRKKALTDASNPVFLAYLKQRTTVNFLEERQQEHQAAIEAYGLRKAQTEATRRADKVPAQFQYSGQALQYSELKKAEQRRKLDRGATYVRSSSLESTYLSSNVPVVDETRLKKEELEESRKRWKTKRGFVYPCPKEPQEYKEHPRKPSRSRAEELRAPWEEGATQGKDLQRTEDPSLNVALKPFDTVPNTNSRLFGGLEAPKFERDYDGSLVGDDRKLPRGKNLTKKVDDITYKRSVHLCCEGLAIEEAEAKRKEKEAFESRVVVDSLDIKIGRFLQIDTPNQTDRLRDILQDPPKKLSLKKVHNATLPSGKRTSFEPAPYSIFTDTEYLEQSNFASSLREHQGSDTWTKVFHRDTLRRASERILCCTTGTSDTPIGPDERAQDRRWISKNDDFEPLVKAIIEHASS